MNHSHFEQMVLDRLECIEARLSLFKERLDKIMATQQELVQQINATKETLVKIGNETTTLLVKIDELKAVIANGPAVTPELQAAVDALGAQAKTIDDLVPDTTP